MRYLRLYRAFVVNNLSRAMEFRAQFLATMVAYGIWAGISLVFIQAVFGQVDAVAGWSRDEMWVLYGSFVVLESICFGLLGPNMWRFSGTVRDGTLDLALTRPVNVQFLVSTRYMDLNGLLNGIVGVALMVVGLARLGQWPGPGHWLLWAVLVCAGVVICYALWFMCVTISVWAVKLEGIAVLFDSLLQMARFPVDIYPRRLLWVFVSVLPVAFLTTFPVRALLGRTQGLELLPALGLAALLLFASHLFFHYALRSYGSASS